MGRLTSAEKDEFQAIFDSGSNLTMGVLEKKVERFVNSLPDDTQKAFAAAKSDYDARISKAVKKSANLSSDAHALVGMLSTVINDNNVTWTQMSNIVRLLHENAGKRVLDELREAEIPFPLGPLPLPQATDKTNA
ncbi:hypothetical protein AAVH_24874 [Aphelenchoides avenae]|nr:hypothetical protein AAVH_24874 [Aphelenchus avenae]